MLYWLGFPILFLPIFATAEDARYSKYLSILQFFLNRSTNDNLHQTFTVIFCSSGPLLCANRNALCIPSNYSKFELPQENANIIRIGVDIKDITKIDEKESTITMTGYFIVKWIDNRIIFDNVSFGSIFYQNKGHSLHEMFVWFWSSLHFSQYVWPFQ